MYRPRSPPPAIDLARFRYRRKLPLSRREQQILWLLSVGLTPREIALLLCRSHYTIGTHLNRIRGKTGCRTYAQLGVWWARA